MVTIFCIINALSRVVYRFNTSRTFFVIIRVPEPNNTTGKPSANKVVSDQTASLGAV